MNNLEIFGSLMYTISEALDFLLISPRGFIFFASYVM